MLITESSPYILSSKMLFSDALLIVPEMFFCETFSTVDFYDYNRLQDCVTALLALSVIRFDCILISAVRADCCTCQLLFSDVTMCACVCLHFSFGPFTQPVHLAE